MTDTLTRVAARPHTPAASRPDRRPLALAALLVAAPVLRGLSIVIHPLDTEDAVATIQHVDDVALRWSIAHLLEPAATLLVGVAAIVLLRLVPDRGRRLAQVGATMFAIGCAGLAMLVHAHGQAYLLMAHDTVDAHDMTELYRQFHEGVPLAAPFIPFFFIGGVLLATALYLSRRVPAWAAVLFGVSTVVPNAIPQDDSLVLAGILGSLPMVIAMVVFARALAAREAT